MSLVNLKQVLDARGLTTSDLARITRLSPHVTVVVYFWVLGANDVRTAGWPLDVQILPSARQPLTLHELAQRGAAYVIREFTFKVLTG